MIAVACLLCFASNAAPSTLPERSGLEGTWMLSQPQRRLSLPARVPGVVQIDLLRAGKIPDPFLRENDKKVQWVGEVPWTYTRTFTLSPAFLRHRRIVLRCEGLDTLARIRVNGRDVAHTDNMFRTWEFDARPFLRKGQNQIQVDFQPIEPFLKAHEVQAAFPGKPVQSHGWGYVRKPPFQQGWDFSPKLITSGIWKKIGLVGWDEARLTDLEIVQDHRTKGQVGLEINLAAETAQPFSSHTTVLYQGKEVARTDSPLTKPIHLTIKDPHLWWPNGMGNPNLYEVRVELRDSQKRVVDRTARRIGLRTIAWIPKTDKSPLTLAVNGRRFFAKGSNLVPMDALLVRTTPADERKMADRAVSANMNLMRLWGGGFYETDTFFDACDEKGLLVWFEFKFADATYPSFDPKWLANVRAEAEDNVRRVRHHPSIAVYSGNNEVIGFIADKTDPGHMSRDDYNLLFHRTLRDVVHALAPDAAYTPGSPEIGDEHDWDVWHGSAGFASYRSVHGFLSEYGFQAFPVPRSIAAFTSPSDRTTLLSPVMQSHQRNWRDGNQLILSTLLRSYRQPRDAESAVWLSQIQQAEGVLTGVEHWRRDWPRSTGSLVWQFNDCWPSISWSMIDYYGRPKALYYRLRHAYAPIALSGLADAKDGSVELWVANDRPQAKRGRIDWTLLRTDGTIVRKGDEAVTIPTGTTSRRVDSISMLDNLTKEGATNLLFSARLRVPGEPDSCTLLTFVRPKELSLQDPELRTSITKETGGYRVTLTSKRPALHTWVELKGINADLSDNFVHVLPGSPVTIRIKPEHSTSLAAVRKALRVRSLYDTYLPGTEANPIVRAEADGQIVATADTAEIVGEGAVLEVGTPSNIGNWTNVADSLRWTVRGAKPGTFLIKATVSIPADEAGSTFEVSIDGSRVTGTVPATKSWTDYVEITLGQVQIEHPGELHLTLRPLTKPAGHVMNLRTLTLSPTRP